MFRLGQKVRRLPPEALHGVIEFSNGHEVQVNWGRGWKQMFSYWQADALLAPIQEQSEEDKWIAEFEKLFGFSLPDGIDKAGKLKIMAAFLDSVADGKKRATWEK